MLDQARESELKAIQEQALDHAVEEMNRAHALGLDTKEDRGDRSWLTGMAAKSLGVAVKIEQFIMLVNREQANPEHDEGEHRATDKLIREARAEVSKVLEKVGGRRGRTD